MKDKDALIERLKELNKLKDEYIEHLKLCSYHGWNIRVDEFEPKIEQLESELQALEQKEPQRKPCPKCGSNETIWWYNHGYNHCWTCLKDWNDEDYDKIKAEQQPEAKIPEQQPERSAEEILENKWGKPQMESTNSADRFLRIKALEAMQEYAELKVKNYKNGNKNMA